MNHQVGVSGVYQVDTDSQLLPVLGLRPLGKSLSGHLGPSDLCNGAEPQGFVRIKPAEITSLKHTHICPCSERALHTYRGAT